MSENEKLPPPSYAEIAYDKTSSIVQSVKGLLFSGISKIKTFIGKPPSTVPIHRERSRTSRSQQRRGRQVVEVSDDEESLDRYKTPNGRSKSRGVTVPVMASEEEHYQDVDDRKRHVNFNINRVISTQPIDDGELTKRSKSAISSRT